MTVPQKIMCFLGAVTIICFVISWLCLSYEIFYRALDRMLYNLRSRHAQQRKAAYKAEYRRWVDPALRKR